MTAVNCEPSYTSSYENYPRREILSPIAERPQKAAVLKIANLLCDPLPSPRPSNVRRASSYRCEDSDDEDADSQTRRSSSVFDDGTTVTSLTSPTSSVYGDFDDMRKQPEIIDDDLLPVKRMRIHDPKPSQGLPYNWSSSNGSSVSVSVPVPVSSKVHPHPHPYERSNDASPPIRLPWPEESAHQFGARRGRQEASRRLPPPGSPALTNSSEPKFPSHVVRNPLPPMALRASRQPSYPNNGGNRSPYHDASSSTTTTTTTATSSSGGSSSARSPLSSMSSLSSSSSSSPLLPPDLALRPRSSSGEYSYRGDPLPSEFHPPYNMSPSEVRDILPYPSQRHLPASEHEFHRPHQLQLQHPHHAQRGHPSHAYHGSYQQQQGPSVAMASEHPPPRFPRRMDTDVAQPTPPLPGARGADSRSPQPYQVHHHHHHHYSQYGNNNANGHSQSGPPTPTLSISRDRPPQQFHSAFTRLPLPSSQPTTPTSPGSYGSSNDYFQRHAVSRRSSIDSINGSAHTPVLPSSRGGSISGGSSNSSNNSSSSNNHHHDAPVDQLASSHAQMQPHSQTQPQFSNMLKAKRKRANANQLTVLNKVFEQTFFPSTEVRIQLGKQLGMSPRTVQIWFQNKRQSWRQKSKHDQDPTAKDENDEDEDDDEIADESAATAAERERRIARKASALSLLSDVCDDLPDAERSMVDGIPSPRSKCSDLGRQSISPAGPIEPPTSAFSVYVPHLTSLHSSRDYSPPASSSSCSPLISSSSPPSSAVRSLPPSPKLSTSRRAHPYLSCGTVSSSSPRSQAYQTVMPAPLQTPSTPRTTPTLPRISPQLLLSSDYRYNPSSINRERRRSEDEIMSDFSQPRSYASEVRAG